MRRIATIAVALALVAAALAAAVASGAAGTRVNTRSTGLGRIITTSKGVTLYLFEKDSRTTSRCSGACASAWPPLITHGKPVAGRGVKASKLGTIKRSDGRRQVTYAGHPLYTFVGDGGRAGSTAGNGSKAFGAEWYALHPSGAKAEHAGS